MKLKHLFIPKCVFISAMLTIPSHLAWAQPSAANSATRPNIVSVPSKNIDEDEEKPAFYLRWETEYNEGYYGEPKQTRQWVNKATGIYASGKNTYALQIPYTQITGPGLFIPGIGVISDHEPMGTQAGLGDIRAGYTYLFKDTPWIAFTASVKLPSGSRAKALGTGSTNYAIGGEFAKDYNKFTSSINVAYNILGNQPNIKVRNIFTAEPSLAYKWTPNTKITLDYYYGQAATPNSASDRELSGIIEQMLNNKTNLRFILTRGFTTATAGWSLLAGVTLRIK